MLEKIFNSVLRLDILSLLGLEVGLELFCKVTGLLLFLKDLPQIVHQLALQLRLLVLPLVICVTLQLILIVLVVQVCRGGSWEGPRQHARLQESATCLHLVFIMLLMAIARFVPLFAADSALKLFTEAVIRLLQSFDFVHKSDIFVTHCVII